MKTRHKVKGENKAAFRELHGRARFVKQAINRLWRPDGTGPNQRQPGDFSGSLCVAVFTIAGLVGLFIGKGGATAKRLRDAARAEGPRRLRVIIDGDAWPPTLTVLGSNGNTVKQFCTRIVTTICTFPMDKHLRQQFRNPRIRGVSAGEAAALQSTYRAAGLREQERKPPKPKTELRRQYWYQIVIPTPRNQGFEFTAANNAHGPFGYASPRPGVPPAQLFPGFGLFRFADPHDTTPTTTDMGWGAGDGSVAQVPTAEPRQYLLTDVARRRPSAGAGAMFSSTGMLGMGTASAGQSRSAFSVAQEPTAEPRLHQLNTDVTRKTPLRAVFNITEVTGHFIGKGGVMAKRLRDEAKATGLQATINAKSNTHKLTVLGPNESAIKQFCSRIVTEICTFKMDVQLRQEFLNPKISSG
jgi:hypothetical protein